MSYHPFPIFVPMGGRTNGPDIPTAQLVRNAQADAFRWMLDMLRPNIEKFNNSKSDSVRKKAIEQLGFMRGIAFPGFEIILHPNRTGFSLKEKRILQERFVVSGSDILIEKLKDSQQEEYVEVARFPMEMLKIKLDIVRLERDRNEFMLTAFYRTGSVENASLESAML